MDRKIAEWFEKRFPVASAQKWDNVGLIIPSQNQGEKILLTIDLTPPVVQECLDLGINHVVCYHPVIFPSVKRIDEVLHKIMLSDISVYCPHTTLDLYLCYELGLFLKSAIIYKNETAVLNGFSSVTTGKNLIMSLMSPELLQGENAFRIVYPLGMDSRKAFDDTIFDSCIIGVGASQDEFKDLVLTLNHKRVSYTKSMLEYNQQSNNTGTRSIDDIKQSNNHTESKTSNIDDIGELVRIQSPSLTSTDENTPPIMNEQLDRTNSSISSRLTHIDIFFPPKSSKTNLSGSSFSLRNSQYDNTGRQYVKKHPFLSEEDIKKHLSYSSGVQSSPITDICAVCHNWLIENIIKKHEITQKVGVHQLLNSFWCFYSDLHHESEDHCAVSNENTDNRGKLLLNNKGRCLEFKSPDHLKSIFNPEYIQKLQLMYNLFFSPNKYNLIITGEMRHHDMLFYQKNSTVVILLEHSRIERFGLNRFAETMKKSFKHVFISQTDRDPVSFITESKTENQ